MNKILGMLTGILPVLNRFLFPNGKFQLNRVLVILLSFVVILTGVTVAGEDTVRLTLELLKPLVLLFGTIPVQ